jgi:hypothetical protein
MREHTRLSHAKLSAEPADAWRYELILGQGIFPAVKEILTSVKLLYPGADICGLTDIMEVALDGIDSIAGNN